MSRRLARVAETARSYNFTEAQVRWWIFQAGQNGLQKEGAIVRIGRRVYIDTQAFDRWIDSLQSSQAAA